MHTEVSPVGAEVFGCGRQVVDCKSASEAIASATGAKASNGQWTGSRSFSWTFIVWRMGSGLALSNLKNPNWNRAALFRRDALHPHCVIKAGATMRLDRLVEQMRALGADFFAHMQRTVGGDHDRREHGGRGGGQFRDRSERRYRRRDDSRTRNRRVRGRLLRLRPALPTRFGRHNRAGSPSRREVFPCRQVWHGRCRCRAPPCRRKPAGHRAGRRAQFSAQPHGRRPRGTSIAKREPPADIGFQRHLAIGAPAPMRRRSTVQGPRRRATRAP